MHFAHIIIFLFPLLYDTGASEAQQELFEIFKEIMEAEYVLGKRVTRNRPSAAFASRSARELPVKEAVQADFISPPSSIQLRPASARQRRPSLGVAPIRKTAVALDPTTRQPLTALASAAEITSERPYSSLSSKKGPSFGPRPSKAFKPFALNGVRREHTELCDAPKGFADEVIQKAKCSRAAPLSAGRSSSTRADKWLRAVTDEVPGPGAYFVP